MYYIAPVYGTMNDYSTIIIYHHICSVVNKYCTGIIIYRYSSVVHFVLCRYFFRFSCGSTIVPNTVYTSALVLL